MYADALKVNVFVDEFDIHTYILKVTYKVGIIQFHEITLYSRPGYGDKCDTSIKNKLKFRKVHF